MEIRGRVVAATGAAQGVDVPLVRVKAGNTGQSSCAAAFIAENDHFTGRSVDLDGGPRL